MCYRMGIVSVIVRRGLLGGRPVTQAVRLRDRYCEGGGGGANSDVAIHSSARNASLI